MAMTPMIVIGCGGSGGKVIASLRQTLEVMLRNAGWNEGIPDAWQLLYVDTPSSQDVPAEFGDPIPSADYVSVSQGQDSYRVIDGAVTANAGTDGLRRLIGWRPSPSIGLPVTNGAGQWRSVGRVAAFNGLPAVAARIETALSTVRGSGAQLERLGERMGDPGAVAGDPFVIIVSSLAGGTGAGIFLDIADVIRTTQPALQARIAGVLFTAEVFQNLLNVPGVQPNTLAALCEMMNGYFDANRSPEPLYRGKVQFGAQVLARSGVNYPFVVGMTTLGGKQLDRITDAYRAVTETIGAALLNPTVAVPLFNNQMTNWAVEQQNNQTAWTFGNAADAVGVSESGVVSSFGSARLSVGVARFGEYAVRRLSRSVVEYLADGYIAAGRRLLNDPHATQQQVVAYYVKQHALPFIEACGLRELNDPVAGEHNMVLDTVCPDADLDSAWRSWVRHISDELKELPQGTPSFWLQKITELIPHRDKDFVVEMKKRCATGESTAMKAIPPMIMAEVARTIAQYGVPITSALVQAAQDHVVSAITQLNDEAATQNLLAGSWAQKAGEVIDQLPASAKLPATHDRIVAAIRDACGGAYRQAKAESRKATAALLQNLSDQVLLPLLSKLDQIQGQLAGTAARTEVAGWPGDQGIPEAFAPPPLEFCLVDPQTWPAVYQDLLTATAAKELEGTQLRMTPEELVRRMVGGGAFDYEHEGVLTKVDSALRLAGVGWTSGPVDFISAFEVNDVVARARLWLNRRQTVFGDFLAQRLGAYLSGVNADGRAVPDLQKRLDRFRDGLQKTLQSATPLIDISLNTLAAVHPNTAMGYGRMTSLIPEKLPLPPDNDPNQTHTARRYAEKVIQPFLTPNLSMEDFFGSGTHDVEGVLYVNRLAGAVHPSAVGSLVGPIAQAWNQVKLQQNSIGPFWQNRRARLLKEFIPVAPSVLDSMIRGWFIGRLLGVISDPDPRTGFQIGYVDDTGRQKRARFPWPLLRSGLQPGLADESVKLEWLPALLESVGLAFALVPSEPDIVHGYDELYKLGNSNVLPRWISTGVCAASIVEPQVRGNDADERRGIVIDSLVQIRAPYTEDLKQTPIVANPQDFYAIPYGFDLYEQIDEALEKLAQSIGSVRGGGSLG